MNRGRIELDALEIRWIQNAGVFFVDFGNVHFAVTKTAALLLADGLHEAVRALPDRRIVSDATKMR